MVLKPRTFVLSCSQRSRFVYITIHVLYMNCICSYFCDMCVIFSIHLRKYELVLLLIIFNFHRLGRSFYKALLMPTHFSPSSPATLQTHDLGCSNSGLPLLCAYTVAKFFLNSKRRLSSLELQLMQENGKLFRRPNYWDEGYDALGSKFTVCGFICQANMLALEKPSYTSRDRAERKVVCVSATYKVP